MDSRKVFFSVFTILTMTLAATSWCSQYDKTIDPSRQFQGGRGNPPCFSPQQKSPQRDLSKYQRVVATKSPPLMLQITPIVVDSGLIDNNVNVKNVHWSHIYINCWRSWLLVSTLELVNFWVHQIRTNSKDHSATPNPNTTLTGVPFLSAHRLNSNCP